MLDDRGDREVFDRGRVRVQRLDLDVEARIGGSEDAIAATLVAGLPVLPASRGHPEAVDQDDRVGCRCLGRHVLSFLVDAPTNCATSPDELEEPEQATAELLIVRIRASVRGSRVRTCFRWTCLAPRGCLGAH
jgi:hypothetical protein